MILNKYSPFYLITVAIAILLVAPFLIQDGMFMDGQQYACVAKNMANGKGSFWHPIVSETWIMAGTVDFIEHPPLFYWLESLSFKLFGNSMYAERIFCLMLLFLNGWMIHRVWTMVSDTRQLSWLPILLWIIVPVCFWSFQNNIIEILLSFFTLLSIYFSLRLVHLKQAVLFHLFLSSFFIFCALLTKALPALFPLMVFPLYYLVFKEGRFKQTVLYTVGSFLIIACLFGLVLLNDEARRYFSIYINERFFHRIANTSTVNYRFEIVINLFSELLIPIILSLLVFLWSKKNQFTLQQKDYQFAYFFMLLGLSASLPLMATMVQKNFYFLAAIPCFAMSFAFLIHRFIQAKIELLNSSIVKIIKMLSYLLLVISIVATLMQVGKISRDEEKLKDVALVGDYFKKATFISTDDEGFFDWGFKFYLLRKYNIELDVINRNRDYFLLKSTIADSLAPRYEPIDIHLKNYYLYKKK